MSISGILDADDVIDGSRDFITSHFSTSQEKEEQEPEYPVKRAEYTSDTASFADDFSFTNAIAVDLNTNTVLAAADADEIIYPASLTKIMTLIVAVENLTDLDQTFTMTEDIISDLFEESASVAGFSAGEAVSVRDMLYGLMLPSGADAAIGLATLTAGGEDKFVEMMNEKASDLGLKNTQFQNCTGLHNDEHYSTCHEIAQILQYAISDELMREIMTTYQYTTSSDEQNPEGILLTSTMFSRMYGNEPECAFVLGGKTGFTLEALYCLASFAVKCEEDESEDAIYSRDPDFLLVTVGSDNMWGPVFDAIDIYTSLSTGKGITDGVITRLTYKY